MDDSTPPSSSSESSFIESLTRTLISRGWCFKDVGQIKELISDQLTSKGPSCTIGSIESELINMDLRAIGGKSLPDPSRLRHASRLEGPKILQISSARDISRSTMDESSGNAGKRRMLRLNLTDGHSQLVAVEYSHVPSLPEDVIPGTKIQLENKAVMHNGIVCLTDKALTVMGGLVQSLFEEWQMNKKYSGFSRPSLQTSDETASSRPPPFEKLQIGVSSQRQAKSSQYSMSSFNSLRHSSVRISENTSSRQTTVSGSQDGKVESTKVSGPSPTCVESSGTSETRQKEVIESVPVQNQAAAQKLLLRMNQPSRDNQNFRGRRYRGKEKEEGPAVLTLDEWERKKSLMSSTTIHDSHNVIRDEDLARQLQEQFDLEDAYGQEGVPVTEAENIKLNMFNYGREEANAHGHMGSRGRGRGRGRKVGRRRG